MSELVSTRDSSQTITDYPSAIVEGLAPDGGLYVPLEFPQVSDAQLHLMSHLTYPLLAASLKNMLISKDIPTDVVYDLAADAYSPVNFPEAEDGNTVPVQRVGDRNIYIQDLSGGPTAAFKDMAMQPLARELDWVLGQQNGSLELLGATSGDTGSAAEAAVKGLGRLSIVMLSPQEGMSVFQQAQMANLSGGNVTNVSVNGRFDDCQDLAKAIMGDPEFNKLGAVNSINIGRILAQVPYYFSGYFQVTERIGESIDVVVPTGNFGNVLAGHIARRMGLPIRRLIIATNENDVVHQLVRTGVYQSPDKAQITSSPSMDITKASNYERLVFEIFGNDASKTAEYMKLFNQTGKVSFAEFRLPTDTLEQMGFDSGSSSHAERLEAIRWVHETGGFIIDPHTADAVTVARKRGGHVPILCMSTARPVKFETTINEALGFVPPRSDRFANLEAKASDDAFIPIEPDLDQLKQIVRHVREAKP